MNESKTMVMESYNRYNRLVRSFKLVIKTNKHTVEELNWFGEKWMTTCDIFKTTFSTYERPMYSRKKVVLTFETEQEAQQFVDTWNEVYYKWPYKY